MCGIAGIVGETPDIERRALMMSGAIAHRGPDADGLKVWAGRDGSRAAFAHRRLAIIDLSEGGKQPMTTADGRYSIVYNGEIYNYLELRSRLASQGATFKTDTDTEVLLALFARDGDQCLSLLRGMFAFAIRDNDT